MWKPGGEDKVGSPEGAASRAQVAGGVVDASQLSDRGIDELAVGGRPMVPVLAPRAWSFDADDATELRYDATAAGWH